MVQLLFKNHVCSAVVYREKNSFGFISVFDRICKIGQFVARFRSNNQAILRVVRTNNFGLATNTSCPRVFVAKL